MAALRSRRSYLVLVLVGLAVAGASLAAPRLKKKKTVRRPPPAPAVVRVEFDRDIKPILAARCCRCHGPDSQKGGLRLDSSGWVRRGGDGGAVVVPGNGADSVLVGVLTAAEDRPAMPPSGERLSGREVSLIKAWIDGGAPAPAGESDLPPSSPHAPEHWAFKPPVSPPVPACGELGHDPNPIDAFLAAGHERHGLTPAPPAPPAVLFRRLAIDLTGLPPTRDELRAFLADPAPDAYERAVERLLASPRHGERWGRHWMDVWRYSDADGRKAKADVWWSSPHLWRWRDWIVGALNADKGYDRMVAEMLAGDELAPDDADTLAATGFLVRNWFKLDRNIWMANTVEHTAKAFLGLTVGCARCHDHKFDPVSQRDYYRFRAFFEPHDVRTTPEEDCGSETVAHAYDLNPDAPTWVFARGDHRSPDKTVRITPGTLPALGGPPVKITPVAVSTPGHPVSTGRRLALARWIADRQNPLAARVAVNHVWARHFGRPLVENVADFGTRTPAPELQPLLDWLAVDFMDHGWSLKHLHRRVVTSAAYRRHSSARGATAATLAADPDNRHYWRMNQRRMEAEVVRDSLLWLGGVLDLTPGGPPLDHARGTDTARRSLYYRYSREDKMPFLTAFDAPGVEECYRRQESVVPQQALALENSPFAWDQARRIARRLEAGAADDFITAAFEHVLGRSPDTAEVEACERFLARQEKLLSDPARLTPFPPAPPPAPPDPEVLKRVPGLPLVLGTAEPLPPVAPAADAAGRAREYLVHALLNHNDFLTVR